MKKICPFSMRGDAWTYTATGYGYLSKSHRQVECIGPRCAAWGEWGQSPQYEGCKVFKTTREELGFEDTK